MKLFNRICRRVAGGLVLAAALAAVPANHPRRRHEFRAAATKPVPYPLKTCVVSGDKLGGDMGEPIVFIYQTNNGIEPGDQVLLPDVQADVSWPTRTNT